MLSGESKLNDTTYLYHPDNKDFYLETLKDFEAKDCIQSRNIINYLDLSEKELSGIPFGKHINNCEICQEKFLEGKALFSKISNNIPQANVSYDNQNQFDENLSTLIRSIKIKKIDKLKLKTNLYIRQTTAVLSDLLRTVFSVKMAIVYVATALFALGMKAFF